MSWEKKAALFLGQMFSVPWDFASPSRHKAVQHNF